MAGRRKATRDTEIRGTKSSELIESLCNLLEPLKEALGPSYEIVIHDLSRLPNSVVGIAGNITSRSPGSPPTNLLLRAIREEKFDDLLEYRSDLPNGRTLRSSTLFIRDSSEEVIGCICINQDITDLIAAKLTLESLCHIRPLERPSNDNSEYYENDPMNILESLVEEGIKVVGQVPALMQREQRLELIKYLEERGAFLIKGSARYVASALGVSPSTIYSYLNEVKH